MSKAMPQIVISYPPPGEFNSQCPDLIVKKDRYGKKTRTAVFVETIRVPDGLAGEAKLHGITAFTVLRTRPEKGAGKDKATNDPLDSGVASEGPKPSAKRVRHFKREVSIHVCWQHFTTHYPAFWPGERLRHTCPE